MAPLILHNVPDDELYVGEDGKQRPYAMVFPHNEGHHANVRGRRAAVAETGSFGKSARRSRSKTATPARREDPTLAAADKVFTSWFEQQRKGSNSAAEDATGPGTLQRKSSGGGGGGGGGGGQGSGGGTGAGSSPADDGPAAAAPPVEKKTPVEVILRGFRSQAQQYAAVNHFELLAGLICEDYPRDPPIENRRYKSELRDPAYTRRRRALTPEERVLVARADGGEHWIKVTFESAAAADVACSESPQSILGHWVYAELYHGGPPARDEAIPNLSSGGVDPAAELLMGGRGARVEEGGRSTHVFTTPRGASRGSGRGATASSFAAPGLPGKFSPSNNSLVSSTTLDTGTLDSLADTVTVSSATATQAPTAVTPGGAGAGGGDSSAVDGTTPGTTTAAAAAASGDSLYCRKVPTVRKAKVLPAELALMPQQSVSQRVLNKVPFLKWFSGSMIGNEVPRTDVGDFDWDRASLYWKFIWWLDATFRLFGGEILNADKDD